MLVLGRRPGERLVIDGPCVIYMVELRGNGARLGIEADDDVSVVRGEILDREAAEAAASKKKVRRS